MSNMRWIVLCVIVAIISELALAQEQRGGFQQDNPFFWSPDGRRIAVIMDETVFAFERGGPIDQAPRVLRAPGATAGAYTADSSVLAVASDTSVSLWRVDADGFTPQTVLDLPATDGLKAAPITTLLFSPDGRFLAGYGCADAEQCRLLVLEIDANRTLIDEIAPYIHTMDFSADGSVLGVAQAAKTPLVNVYPIDVRRIVLTNPDDLVPELWSAGQMDGFRFSPAGVVLDIDAQTMLATGIKHNGPTIQVVSLPDFESIVNRTILTEAGLVVAVPDGTTIAYYVPYFLMIYDVYNAEDRRYVRESFDEGYPPRLIFNHDGTSYALITEWGALIVRGTVPDESAARMLTPYGNRHIEIPGAG
jgi:hypothetical protein